VFGTITVTQLEPIFDVMQWRVEQFHVIYLQYASNEMTMRR